MRLTSLVDSRLSLAGVVTIPSLGTIEVDPIVYSVYHRTLLLASIKASLAAKLIVDADAVVDPTASTAPVVPAAPASPVTPVVPEAPAAPAAPVVEIIADVTVPVIDSVEPSAEAAAVLPKSKAKAKASLLDL